MKANNLWKAVPFAALILCLQMPAAMAGGTNTGDNTNASPGDNSSATKTPANPGSERRKGTTNTQDMKTPGANQHKDMSNSSGSGSMNNDGSSSGTGTGTGH